MLNIFDVDNNTVLDDWLKSENADIRKGYISLNEFDITGA